MPSADTAFVDKVTQVVSAWLQPVNDWIWKGRNPTFATTTGSVNAQVLTLPATSLYASVADGDTFTFKAGYTNTGAMTLSVVGGSTVGPYAVQLDGSALTGGEVVSGDIFQVVALGTTWQLSRIATSAVRAKIGAAASGANSDITSLSGLTTPLSQPQGGTGANLIPSFCAHCTNSQNFTTGSVLKVQFNSVDFNIGSYYDNITNYRFTPLVAGYYAVHARLNMQVASGASFGIYIYKNGAGIAEFDGVGTGLSGGSTVQISARVQMNGSTDYLECYAGQASGSTEAVNSTARTSEFSAFRWG